MRYIFIFLLFLALSCAKESNKSTDVIQQIPDGEVADSLKINQLQYLGSHNSYRKITDQDVLDFLYGLGNLLPSYANPQELEYDHLPLWNQFTEYGVRQIELDLHLDNNGGKFYNRQIKAILDKPTASEVEELKNNTDIKLFHIPDIDYNTHHYTFKSALKEIKKWSATYPEHLPIFILLELSETSVNDHLPNMNFAIAEKWDNINDLEKLENEILSVFDKTEIILPSDVQGNFATLNEAVLNHNWPTVKESRGKIMFLHNNSGIITQLSIQNNPNLENRIVFTNGEHNESHTAFIMRNSINTYASEIEDLVAKGYLVRTRVDEGTFEARNNDYSKWNKGLKSGAHFLSTDYYKPDHRAGDGTWSNYSVGFNNNLYRINPIAKP